MGISMQDICILRLCLNFLFFLGQVMMANLVPMSCLQRSLLCSPTFTETFFNYTTQNFNLTSKPLDFAFQIRNFNAFFV